MKTYFLAILILFCASFGFGQKKSNRERIHRRKPISVASILKARKTELAPPLQVEPSSEVFLITSLPDMPEHYIALEGDTIAKIAARLKMSANFLAEINQLSPDSPLVAGQKIIVSLR